MSSSQQPHFKKKLLSSALILICSTGIGFSQNPTAEETLVDEELLAPVPSVNLSSVVVTAGGFAQEVKEAPASISVVGKEAMEVRPFKNVADAISEVPGVTITGSAGSEDISIRGMGSDYTMIMVDGKRQSSRAALTNGAASGTDIAWIPPLAAIERIEVVRGPMSSLYGSDAMGGVVNIITKKITDQWMGNVRLDATFQNDSDAGNSQTAEFFVGGPVIQDKLGLQVYGKYQNRSEDKFLDGIPERKLHSGGAKATFVPVEGHTFEVDYGVAFQRTEATVGNTVSTEPSRGQAPSDDVAKSKRYNGSLRYMGEYDNGFTTNFLLSHEKTNNYSRQMIIKNSEASGNVLMPLGDHMVTVGAQYRKENLKDNNNAFNKDVDSISRWSYAIFAEDEWWLLDNLALTGGLRYDKDENFGSHISPRIYAVWNATDTLTVKGGISTGYKTPALRDTVSDWGFATGGNPGKGNDPRVMILGNPDLKPEKSTNYELGFTFTPTDTFEASVTGFYTEFKDKIQTVTTCTTPTKPSTNTGRAGGNPNYPGGGGNPNFPGGTGNPNFAGNGKPGSTNGNSNTGNNKPAEARECIGSNGKQYVSIQTRENVDKATIKGLELAAKWRATESLRLDTSYTYMESEQKTGDYKGQPLNRIPKHQLNVKLDWQAQPNLNLWAQAKYRGKETQAASTRSSLTTYAGYTLVDVGAVYQVNRDVKLHGGIYNLTNKVIDDETYGRTLDGTRYWIGIDINF